MEVGAVKQAFNNEVILLKKKLNQAKIHVIHKLTRKAKTLTVKKTPEHLKEKLKRKAESAVNEVLLIKKIKARDIAKFIITHTGEVKDFLNRPTVDNDKACARLVLHKSLQDKYKFIRNRFGNVPIKDLFMSRQERRKIKKEEREQKKNKKKGKEEKVVNAAGDWDVEDMDDDSKDIGGYEIGSDGSVGDGSELSDAEQTDQNNSEKEEQDDVEHSNDEDVESTQSDKDNSDGGDDDDEIDDEDANSEIGSDTDDKPEVGKYIKLKPEKEVKKSPEKLEPVKMNIIIPKADVIKIQKKTIETKSVQKQADKKIKDSKNKNLKEKLQNRKFKKNDNENLVEGRKVVDPFFITASGENYMSLAEPRQPDEVKEVHGQGNRQERRAAMFGHVAKFKPRRDNFRSNNNFDRKDDNDSKSSFRNNNRSNNDSKFNDRNGKFNDRNGKFNDRNDKFNGKNDKFNDRNNKFNSSNSNDEKKDEKLHPSWEAKRKMKSMSLLPALGKKIVFD